jgi:hypothetical protein
VTPQERITQWHEDFQQLQQDWRQWLAAHDNYRDFRTAWQAYQVQLRRAEVVDVARTISATAGLPR